ncbi:AB hydrolase superfamily protein [Fulvia fulva]|nr:AB hydrolase superfamily protein [Fulvia fulva]KAK4620478.1 AB hydrolase superfamily protein [Fulvia fulva]WPV17216.1 AB hydrolase superfamily protein [Fulvia fulva]WPV31905.1 AB hydrolase superfamily protein [Fulvia fulva]
MPFTTFGVATAVTPSVIETYFSHFLNRGPLKQKPTAHISYHEGLRLIRQFLDYSAKHPVEDLQSFTAQWVPVPTWVKTQDVEIPPQFLTRSANVIRKQLGSNGIERVGGEKWWQWRRSEAPLHAEWIEMKKDYNERKRMGIKCDRVILYIHGGAYYFGSVDEHRYQMQRHARKLKARVLAPRYRLAPQFPFPCGLYDCIATYFYLLEHFEPSQILFAGDSAGGGMVLSLLVTLRDQGCPLPAGTILLSPWVDLTHSFPSTAGDGTGDYIPPHGFHHKPSMTWPPPPQTEEKANKLAKKFTQPIEQPFEVVELPADMGTGPATGNASRGNFGREKKPQPNLNQLPGMGERLEINIDGKLLVLKEQIQLYAKNDLLTHPLVSPVQQPSLGGLPPMLIQVGGGELLRDEQIYLAHKAANPRRYVPSEAIMEEYDPQRIVLNQYPPTDVQLQVWEDLCHVPHTLSFTRPAKYMYRSVAQFGAWALARAQHKGIEILDDDAISIISNKSDGTCATEGTDASGAERQSEYGSIGADGVTSSQFKLSSVGAVGKAGDELPPFVDHMIRQRVNRHGVIYPLPHESNIASLHLDPSTIGTIKVGPVRKWLAKRTESEQKFANDYKKLLKKRAKELKEGYDPIETGENPPPTALYLRRKRDVAPEEKKKSKSWGLAMWSGWGSSHDESTIQREEKALDDKSIQDDRPASTAPSTATQRGASSVETERGLDHNTSDPTTKQQTVPGNDGTVDAETTAQRRRSSASVLSAIAPWSKGPDLRPRSPYRQVKDVGQTEVERSSAVSPTLSPTSPVHGGTRWDSSRRSSQASSIFKFATRPLSVAGPVASSATKSQLQTIHTPASPTSNAIAPSASDTGKDAVKVPGTDATYLNPDGNRPHNGVVAYPFKLRSAQNVPRQPSPNPSTMTLDSNVDGSDNATERNGSLTYADAPRPGSTILDHYFPPNVDQLMHAKDGESVGQSAERQGLETSTTADNVPITGGVSQDALNTFQSNISGGRPVSVLSDTPLFKHLKSPEEDPVSPLSEAAISPLEASSATSADPASKPRYKQYKPTRDSRLGLLGGDGMPLSAFPTPDQKEIGMAITDSAPKPAPFKIRNPVFDPRAVPEQVPEHAAVQQVQPEANAEASKPAPFKMRHTIYDSKVAPPGSKHADEQTPAVPASNGRAATGSANATKREVTPSESLSTSLPAAPVQLSPITPISPLVPLHEEKEAVMATSDIAPTFIEPPANTNITFPTVSSSNARPVADPRSTEDPPAPPPKDKHTALPQLRSNPSSASMNGGYSLVPALRSKPSNASINASSPIANLRSSPSQASMRDGSMSSMSNRNERNGSVSGSIKRKQIVPKSKFAADPDRTMTALEAAGLAPAPKAPKPKKEKKDSKKDKSSTGLLGKLSFERKGSVPSIEEQVQKGYLSELQGGKF